MNDNQVLHNAAHFYAYSLLRMLTEMKFLTDEEAQKIDVLNAKSFGSNLIIL